MDISELSRINSLAKINRHPWELTRSRIIYSLLKKNSPEYSTIIDFGSGDSFVLHELELKKMAGNYFAIDNAYTENLVQSLKKQYPGSAISMKSSLHTIGGSFLPADCMLFLDVLEHCENDYEILRSAISEKFAENQATILITVPAFQALFSEHDQLLNHYRRYNIKQLITLCEKAGLTVVSSGYFFSSLLIIRSIQLFLEKIRLKKKSRSLDSWNSGYTITRIFASLLWIDFRVGNFLNKIGIKLPGLSSYCLCSKKLA